MTIIPRVWSMFLLDNPGQRNPGDHTRGMGHSTYYGTPPVR